LWGDRFRVFEGLESVPGLFISFEGIEHCGKTTQSKSLAKHLEDEGHRVVLTREPGGTPLGTEVRELLLHRTQDDVSTTAELLLFAADRAQHVDTLIRPALADGQIVICDRFFDSTRAYQGYGRGIDASLIDGAIHLATDGLEPDLTITMDITVAESRARAEETDDRIEQESNAFFQRVRDGFLEIAESTSHRTVLIDGTADIQAVAKIIQTEVGNRLASS